MPHYLFCRQPMYLVDNQASFCYSKIKLQNTTNSTLDISCPREVPVEGGKTKAAVPAAPAIS